MLKNVILFEKLWAAYVSALETYDAARANRSIGHGRRVCRGARRKVETIYARLASEYGMNLGGAL